MGVTDTLLIKALSWLKPSWKSSNRAFHHQTFPVEKIRPIRVVSQLIPILFTDSIILNVISLISACLSCKNDMVSFWASFKISSSS